MLTFTVTTYGTAEIGGITDADAYALTSTGAVAVTPKLGGQGWTITAGPHVGVVSTAGVQLRILPRIPVARLIFLLGYSQDPHAWRDDPVGLDDQADLWPAMAQVFSRKVDEALQRGLLQGYRTEESALLVVRGRLREADQLRRRAGLAVPLEVRYDEYDTDIAENRILRAAAERLSRLPRMPAAVRRRLQQLALRLGEVSRLVPGQPIPDTPPTRLNARYQPALALARMVLRTRSVDVLDTGVRATGFLVNMNSVFEDFVTTALTEALAPFGGHCKPQDNRHRLDEAGNIVLRPDLVYYREHQHIAVVDAKYKRETFAAYPNADLYQMLAYCTALQLGEGHLVYAEGSDTAPRVRVQATDVMILQHALDLRQPVAELLRQVDGLARRISDGTGPPSPKSRVDC